MSEVDNNLYKYTVSEPEGAWESFEVYIHKGKLVGCKGMNHPIGSDWKSLRAYYEKIGAKIDLINEDGN